jgi:hypothetical protein
MKIKDIFYSWDFILALLSSILILILLPYRIANEFAHDIYGIGISVLSIVFSVYFAALAIMIASSDDDFIRFLEEEGDYTAIISTFKFSLLILFVALLYSLAIYTVSSAQLAMDCKNQPFWWFVIFTFLFLWGLFAAANSTYDSITYAKFRTKFLSLKNKS